MWKWECYYILRNALACRRLRAWGHTSLRKGGIRRGLELPQTWNVWLRLWYLRRLEKYWERNGVLIWQFCDVPLRPPGAPQVAPALPLCRALLLLRGQVRSERNGWWLSIRIPLNIQFTKKKMKPKSGGITVRGVTVVTIVSRCRSGQIAPGSLGRVRERRRHCWPGGRPSVCSAMELLTIICWGKKSCWLPERSCT